MPSNPITDEMFLDKSFFCEYKHLSSSSKAISDGIVPLRVFLYKYIFAKCWSNPILDGIHVLWSYFSKYKSSSTSSKAIPDGIIPHRELKLKPMANKLLCYPISDGMLLIVEIQWKTLQAW